MIYQRHIIESLITPLLCREGLIYRYVFNWCRHVRYKFPPLSEMFGFYDLLLVKSVAFIETPAILLATVMTSTYCRPLQNDPPKKRPSICIPSLVACPYCHTVSVCHHPYYSTLHSTPFFALFCFCEVKETR